MAGAVPHLVDGKLEDRRLVVHVVVGDVHCEDLVDREVQEGVRLVLILAYLDVLAELAVDVLDLALEVVGWRLMRLMLCTLGPLRLDPVGQHEAAGPLNVDLVPVQEGAVEQLAVLHLDRVLHRLEGEVGDCTGQLLDGELARVVDGAHGELAVLIDAVLDVHLAEEFEGQVARGGVQYLEALAAPDVAEGVVRERADDEGLGPLLAVDLVGLLVGLELGGVVLGVVVRLQKPVVVVRVGDEAQLLVLDADHLQVRRHKALRDCMLGKCRGLVQCVGGVVQEVFLLCGVARQ